MTEREEFAEVPRFDFPDEDGQMLEFVLADALAARVPFERALAERAEKAEVRVRELEAAAVRGEAEREEELGLLRAENERLKGAIETLVADELISASRAIELHGMSHDQQRVHWRHLCTRERAIQLTITPQGQAEVSVENEGEWVPVISELHIEGGIVGHIVEKNGIRRALDAHRTQQKEQGDD